jgi:hypothetical protein
MGLAAQISRHLQLNELVQFNAFLKDVAPA